MKKIYLVVICLAPGLLPPVSASAQQLPVLNHNYLIPYVYNPAYAAADDVGEINLINRQQWLGLEGSPSTSALSFQFPVKEKISIGANIYHDQYGLLTNMSALGTLAYRINLTPNSHIQAGLSFGYARQSLDIDELENPEDQAALINHPGATGRIDGNAGFMYQWNKLRIGVALPRLFANDIVVAADNRFIKLSRLDYWLMMASYRFNVGPTWAIEPSANYRAATGIPNQYEVYLTAYFNEKIWAGVSHRQHYSPSVYVGATFNVLRVGYNYELSTAQVEGFTNATHEVTLGLRVGKRRSKSKTKLLSKNADESKDQLSSSPAVASQVESPAQDATTPPPKIDPTPSSENRAMNTTPETPTNDASATKNGKAAVTEVSQKENNTTQSNDKVQQQFETSQTKAVTKKSDNQSAPSIKQPSNTQDVTRRAETDNKHTNKVVTAGGKIVTVDKPDVKDGEERIHTKAAKSKDSELSAGYYVVVGAFRLFDNAVKFSQKLQSRDFKAQVKYSPYAKFYYVYFVDAPSVEAGRIARGLIRQEEEFKDAWLLIVEP